ncbi:MAG: hypothetical protein U0L62_02575 [Paludibacteraceae bacterium]|nr:hypothetical protein [Paludibacteraceae bacterium]
MSKQFNKNIERLSKAVTATSSDKKATLVLHCDEVAKEFFIGYSGKIEWSDDKIKRKHDELIMQILIEDDEVYKFIERIFTPVQRYRRRQQKKVNYAAPKAAYCPNPKQ